MMYATRSDVGPQRDMPSSVRGGRCFTTPLERAVVRQQERLRDIQDFRNQSVTEVSSPHPYPEFGEFTPDQISLMREMFDDGDKDRDGRIDHVDLSRVLDRWGSGITPMDARELLVQIDSDFDDRIDFRDFLALWRRAHEGDVPCAVRTALGVTVMQLGLDPRAETSSRLRFAGARGFFENHVKTPTEQVSQQQVPRRQGLYGGSLSQHMGFANGSQPVPQGSSYRSWMNKPTGPSAQQFH